jgi:hemerythrin superfamily protein
MKSAEHWLVHNHTQIEVLLRQCREEADIYDWWALNMYFQELVKQLRFHLAQEEEVLYPAYNAKADASHDFTAKLVQQHTQVVDIARDIYTLIEDRTKRGLTEKLDALISVLHAHNREEEGVFLPYASHLLYDDRERLAEQLEGFNLSEKSRVWGI